MNNINDINDIKIYSSVELQRASSSVLQKMMKDYAIKANGRTKKDLIDAIIQYQDYVSELRNKLTDDSHSIDNYHRGVVSYSLPTIIIYRIIRDLWHHEILENKHKLFPSLAKDQETLKQIQQLKTETNQNKAQVHQLMYQPKELDTQLLIERLHSKIKENEMEINKLENSSTLDRRLKKSHRWLLSLAVLSKEFFKLISTSLFTSIRLGRNYYPDDELKMKTVIMNPYNVMKNITTLTLTIYVLNRISSLNNAVELKLIFGSVERLIINGEDKKIDHKYFGLIGNAMSKLQHLQIETAIDTIKIQEIIQTSFHSIISLDLSESVFYDISFDMKLLPPNLSILYLPEESKTNNNNNINNNNNNNNNNKSTSRKELKNSKNSKKSKSKSKLWSNSYIFTEIGMHPSHRYFSKLLTPQLKKLYIQGNDIAQNRFDLPNELFEFIASDRCNLTKLTLNFNILNEKATKYQELQKLLTSVNKSKITTFKLICHDNRSMQPSAMNIIFKLIVPIENIKRFTLVFRNINYLMEHFKLTNDTSQPTGFITTRNTRMDRAYFVDIEIYHLKRVDLSNTTNTTTDEIIKYNPDQGGEIEYG